ncbi:hypothetical protein AWZ03_009341 [Drosophila navojoa]|uniref:Uncharacterized protein n=1 Tax=Drosophila navojoa TaxID=7232 RepID=A0A484B8Q6_DRONA|nr:hypothetical protein AWZ03_009341 [Drosophila navojoa]
MGQAVTVAKQGAMSSDSDNWQRLSVARSPDRQIVASNSNKRLPFTCGSSNKVNNSSPLANLAPSANYSQTAKQPNGQMNGLQ